jgi:hypothetical protein
VSALYKRLRPILIRRDLSEPDTTTLLFQRELAT